MLITPATAAPDEAHSDRRVDFDILSSVHFIDESRKPLIRPEWDQTPDAEHIDAAFAELNTGAGYAELTCSLAEDRTLETCRIGRSDPATEEVEQAFLSLAREYRLSEGTARPEEVKVVSLLMRLGREGELGACGIFCIPIPLPPPPPPPPVVTPVVRDGIEGVLKCYSTGRCEFVPNDAPQMPSPSREMLQKLSDEGPEGYIECTLGGECVLVPLDENQARTREKPSVDDADPDE